MAATHSNEPNTLVLVVALLAGWTAGPPARAQGTPHGDDFQVNTYTTSFQAFPTVASSAAGDFVVTWTSFGSYGGDSSYTSVQLQRFTLDGAPLGGQLQVNSFTQYMQALSQVGADAAGNFVVAWSSLGSPGDDDDAYSVQARRYAADNASLDDQFQVNGYTTGTQCCAAVAVAPAGGFVLVWSSDGSDGSDSSGSSVQGQCYDAAGPPLGGELQVNSYTTSSQGSAAVAVAPAGGFVVVWTSDGSGGDDSSLTSIQARRFDADGAPLGDDFQVNGYTTNAQDRARLAFAPDGGFVVVWQSLGSNGTDSDNASVQAQLFDAAGAPIGAQFQVNSYTTGAQDRPAVAPDAHGFVVVWTSAGSDGNDTDGSSIQRRYYEWDGSPRGGELQVNSYTTGAQSSAAVATDALGNFVVTWQSPGSAGTDTGSTSIQARRFDGLFRDGFETADTSRWSVAVP